MNSQGRARGGSSCPSVQSERLERRTLLSATISGVVYNDANHNGQQDSGEAGLDYWEVFLDDNRDGIRDGAEAVSFTSSIGAYSFANVTAGDHRVEVIREQWWDPTSPTIDSMDVHAADGQFVIGQDFGESYTYTSGNSAGGLVFEDLDGNGLQDSVEGGLAETTVYADLNRNNTFDAGEPSTTTNSYGNYWLTGLPAGDYPFRVSASGWTQTNQLVFEMPTPSGYVSATLTMKRIGASITGTIYEDANANGKRDTGERGEALFTAYDDANNNNQLDSNERWTKSNADGFYNLTGLSAGTHKVRMIPWSPYVQTAPANNYGWSVTVTANQQVGGKDFGARSTAPPPPASISGTVWNDLDADKVKESNEAFVPNITIYNDANNNSKLDAGEMSTVTDSLGAYRFSNLAAGSYKIRQVLQSGWMQTSPANGYGWTITLATSQALFGQNFGTKQGVSLPPPAGGSISGTVWNDLDGDGVKDANELGLSGITVYNDANNNSKLDTGEKTTATDSSGAYQFTGLSSGSYKIREVLQGGWIQTTPAKNYGWSIALATNQVLTGRNFGTEAGNVSPPSGKISGTIFNDLDGDGVKDSNEIGVGAGWTVYIDLDNDSVLDSNEVSTTTDGNGAWTLSGLAAGTYKVRQVLQTGWKQTTPTNNYGLNVTLSANQSVGAKLFGSRRIA